MVESATKDVVCGMRMTVREARYASEYGGRVYRFCSDACKATFDRDPAKYTVPSNGLSDLQDPSREAEVRTRPCA